MARGSSPATRAVRTAGDAITNTPRSTLGERMGQPDDDVRIRLPHSTSAAGTNGCWCRAHWC